MLFASIPVPDPPQGCTKPFEVMPNNSADPDTTALSSQKAIEGVVGGEGLSSKMANPSLLFSAS